MAKSNITNINKIKKLIKKHEGYVLYPYKDQVGVLTIGWGHNLEKHGISKYVAQIIFEEDFKRAYENAEKISEYHNLNWIRKGILINMVFNLGLYGVLGFKKMLSALRNRKFDDAADEMLDSRWARQVGNRAIELAHRMKVGK